MQSNKNGSGVFTLQTHSPIQAPPGLKTLIGFLNCFALLTIKAPRLHHKFINVCSADPHSFDKSHCDESWNTDTGKSNYQGNHLEHGLIKNYIYILDQMEKELNTLTCQCFILFLVHTQIPADMPVTFCPL